MAYYEYCSNSRNHNNRDVRKGTVDSRYLEFQGTLWKHFEISVPRNIRVVEVRKTISRTTTFNKCICNLTLEVKDILKILRKRGEIAPSIFCYLFFDFHVKTGTRISLRDKRLFEISEVEITRVDCTFGHVCPAKIHISLFEQVHFTTCQCLKAAGWAANSVAPDQTSQDASADQSLHSVSVCLSQYLEILRYYPYLL